MTITRKNLAVAMLMLAGGAAWAQMTPVGTWRSIDDSTGEPKAQVVITARSGWPSCTRLFSVSVAVGQACTQAPQDTHSEVRKLSPPAAATRDSKPRPVMVKAKVPWISSQARTHRLQTMHLLGS